MSNHIFQNNLLSSSLLVLSLFLLSPEGKAMEDNKYENTIESKKGWKSLPIDWDNSPNRERFPKQAILTEKDEPIAKLFFRVGSKIRLSSTIPIF